MARRTFVGRCVDTPSFDEIRGLDEITTIVVDENGVIERIARGVEEPGERLGEREFLVPGFIDAHIHATQLPFAGTGLDRPLMADDGFLKKYAFPTERRAEWYSEFVDELIKQGTTTALVFATGSCDVPEGPRCYVGKVSMDRFCEDTTTLEETEDFVQRTLARGGIPVITPRFLPTCSEPYLRGLGALAKKYNLLTQTHMSESIDELDFSWSLFQRSDAQVLKEHGLLGIVAHCTHLVEGELELVEAIAHCPLSNFYFAKEALPVKQLVKRGITVALGTDVAGGYSPSMLNAMRSAVLASKTLQFKRHPRSIFPQSSSQPEDQLEDLHDITHFQSLYLATAAGAKALKNPKIGLFEVGNYFDALILSAEPTVRTFKGGTAEAPRDVFHKILCLGDDRNVKAVFVEGKQLK